MDGRHARRVLRVASDASPEEIRRAYHAQLFAAHPDHGGNAETFAEVRAAFAVLRDAEPKRRFAALPLFGRPAPRVDVYDSPRRAPRRDFADVLRAASARFN
jgi:curved DNA-binding protein CbpA